MLLGYWHIAMKRGRLRAGIVCANMLSGTVLAEVARMGRKRFKSFPRASVEGHLKARHSLCPPELLEHFVELLATREWGEPVTIGQAFGLVSHAHVRHAMTDYERLLRIPGMTRDEALMIVRPEVVAIVASWATPRATGAAELTAGDVGHVAR